MKLTIQVTANVNRVTLIDKTIEFPEVETYYISKENFNGDRCLAVYALIPKYVKDKSITYNICKIERNTQTFTDFIPTNDCKTDTWFSKGTNSDLRREFLEMLEGYFFKPIEITKEEFFKQRQLLLDAWIKE